MQRCAVCCCNGLPSEAGTASIPALACCDVYLLVRVQVLQTFNSETGTKEAISYRCSDMDRQVPHIMGVSKVCRRHIEDPCSTSRRVAMGEQSCPATNVLLVSDLINESQCCVSWAA